MMPPSPAISEAFSDPEAVTRYAEGPPRFVPGFADLHRMTAHPAGGAGCARRAACWCWAPAAGWSSRHWRRPSRLDLRRRRSGRGDAEARRADARAAQCARAVAARLYRRCARWAVRCRHLPADAAFPRCRRTAADGAGNPPPPQTRRALCRRPFQFPASATASARDGYRATPPMRSLPAPTRTQANNARAAVDAHLSLLNPEQDAQILREAGFRNVELFYAAFTWRGWVGYA